MSLISKLIAVLLASVLGLNGCVAVSETSKNYRRLSAATLDTIKTDMHKAEVLKILGNPWTVITYGGRPNETYLNWYWTANVNDAMIFAAVIDRDDKVIRTERWLDPHDPRNMSADTKP
jgi:outer membrane protein assembly factor BamE (lipoprotein component of BamABCDE complex)